VSFSGEKTRVSTHLDDSLIEKREEEEEKSSIETFVSSLGCTMLPVCFT
jgi:hypothetical protein